MKGFDLIVFEPDPSFGEKTEWEDLFFMLFHSIIVAPDGSIFVSDNRKHKIHKFNSSGELVKTFGRKGEGPGDLYLPGCRSFYRGELLVGEYASRKRVSFFDTEGKFLKIVKTRREVFNAFQVDSDNMIYSYSGYQESAGDTAVTTKLVYKNMDTGKDRIIDVWKSKIRVVKIGTNKHNLMDETPIFFVQ